MSDSTEQSIQPWLMFLIVGAINDHWWMGSQDGAYLPDECGPCGAVRDMPPQLREDAVRAYERLTGDDGASAYWDTTRDTFRAGVDFSRPCNVDALLAAADTDDDQ